jgi:uncharacterized protein
VSLPLKVSREDIVILTPKWGQTWELEALKKDDNGVIILLAKAEKNMAINQVMDLKID